MHRHNGQSGKIIPFVVRVLARPRRLRFVVVVVLVVLQKNKQGNVGGGRRCRQQQ